MNLIVFPWAALMAMKPLRSSQVALFVYGWIEREHVLNASAYADWWMRAIGLAAARIQPSRQVIEKAATPVAPRSRSHGGDRAGSGRFRSTKPARLRS